MPLNESRNHQKMVNCWLLFVGCWRLRVWVEKEFLGNSIQKIYLAYIIHPDNGTFRSPDRSGDGDGKQLLQQFLHHFTLERRTVLTTHTHFLSLQTQDLVALPPWSPVSKDHVSIESRCRGSRTSSHKHVRFRRRHILSY